MCSMKLGTRGPNSATRNDTRCVIKPEMKCTSRDSRSSFATTIEQASFLACASALRSMGRRSSASALAGLDLLVLGHDREAVRLGEARDHLALGVQPQPAPALRAGRDAHVSHHVHFEEIPYESRQSRPCKHIYVRMAFTISVEGPARERGRRV